MRGTLASGTSEVTGFVPWADRLCGFGGWQHTSPRSVPLWHNPHFEGMMLKNKKQKLGTRGTRWVALLSESSRGHAPHPPPPYRWGWGSTSSPEQGEGRRPGGIQTHDLVRHLSCPLSAFAGPPAVRWPELFVPPSVQAWGPPVSGASFLVGVSDAWGCRPLICLVSVGSSGPAREREGMG